MKFQTESNQVVSELVRKGSAVLIDVREKFEFKEDSLGHAINLPLSRYNPVDYAPYYDKTIYLICHSGVRAERIAKRLARDAGMNAVLVENHMAIFLKSKISKFNRVRLNNGKLRFALRF